MALAFLSLVACGDDDGPLLDAAPPDSALDECTSMVSAGGALTLDDALATASDGSIICLGPGEHAPPTRPLDRAMTLRGAGSAERIGSSVIAGGLGACLSEDLVSEQRSPTTDRVPTEAAVVVRGAPVTLESMVITGCPVGIASVDADLVLDDVRVLDVVTGVHAEGGSVTARAPVLRVGSFRPLPSDGPGSLGFFLWESTLALRSGELEATGAVGSVLGFRTSVDIEETSMLGGIVGFFLVGDGATTARIGAGTEVRRLRTSSEAIATARNTILDMSSDIDGLSVLDSDGIGLALGNVSATLRDLTLEADQGLLFEGGSVRLLGTNRLITNEYGLVARGTDRMMGALTIEGSVESRGSPTVHLDVGGSGPSTVEVAGSFDAEGGSAAVAMFTAAASLTVTGILRSRDHALVSAVAYEGTLDLGAADISGAPIGIAGLGNATITTGAATIDDVDVGVDLQDSASLVAEGIQVTAPRTAGLLLRGAPSTLRGGSVTGSAGVGILTSADLTADGVSVSGSGAAGIEAQEGASLTLENATLDSNTGAAVAYRDASGTVRASTFAGTTPGADGRADEILLEGPSDVREVIVEQNNFDLTVSRTCTAQCAVFMASGPGATGIVRPNCLRASAAADTLTIVDQDGSSFMVEPDLVWTTLLAGPGSDLGLAIGTAASLPFATVTLAPSLANAFALP